MAVVDQDREALRQIIERHLTRYRAGEVPSESAVEEVYAPTLRRLAAEQPEIHQRLLAIVPAGDPARTIVSEWLSLLDEIGSIDALAAGEGSPQAWLTKMIARSVEGTGPILLPPPFFAVIRKLAARLASDRQPIDLYPRRANRAFIDADLCDHALELRIPLKDPPPGSALSLISWASPPERTSDRGRPLLYLANDSRFRPLLEGAIDKAATDAAFQKQVTSSQPVQELWRFKLNRLLDLVEAGTLASCETAVDRLEQIASNAVFRIFPDMRQRLGSISIAESLGRTLREGILDEFGWPELEDAIESLEQERAGAVRLGGVFPFLVASNDRRAVAVGPSGRLAEHLFQLPAEARLLHLRYVGGQILVMFLTRGERVLAYWTGDPRRLFPQDVHYWGESTIAVGQAAVELAGGVTEGDRVIRAGDAEIPSVRNMWTDGKQYWQERCSLEGCHLHTYDPISGDWDEAPSVPSFLEAPSGLSLDWRASQLLTLPDSRIDTSLGHSRGLAGFRASYRKISSAENVWECERIDGATYSGRLPGTDQPWGLMNFPGHVRPRLVTVRDAPRTPRIVLWGGNGQQELGIVSMNERHPAYAHGTDCVLPPHCWHLLRPRDFTGSIALRGVSDLDAEMLVRAAEATPPQLDTELSRRLPHIVDQRLALGVKGLAVRAAQLAKRIERLTERAADPAAVVHDPRMDRGLLEVAEELQFVRSVAGGRTTRSIEAVAAFFEDLALAEPSMPCGSVRWEDLIGCLGALGYVIAVPGRRPEARAALLSFLNYWSRTIFCRERSRIRATRIRWVDRDTPVSLGATAGFIQMVVRDGNRYAIFPDDADFATVVEFAPQRFHLLPGAALVEERRGDSGFGDSAEIQSLITTFTAGASPVQAEIIEHVAAATGLSHTQATALWAGCPKGEPSALPGLTEAQFQWGRESVSGLAAGKGRETLLQIYAAAFAGPSPDYPALAARLSQAWIAAVGYRQPVPESLMMEADTQLRLPVSPVVLLPGITSPETAGFLNNDASWRFAPNGELTCDQCDPATYASGDTNPWRTWILKRLYGHPYAEPRFFSSDALLSISMLSQYLRARLPEDDPFYQASVRIQPYLRSRLRHPELLVEVGFTTRRDRARAIHGLLGTKVVVTSLTWSDGPAALVRDAGMMVTFERDEYVVVACRPSRLKSQDERTLLAGIAALCTLRDELDGKVIPALLDFPVFTQSPAILAESILSAS